MQPQQGSSISPRVNFGDRHASLPQQALSMVIWGGTVLLAIATVWSYSARNVILKTASDCIHCPAGYHTVGPASCPRMCVSGSLQLAIEQTCVHPPILAAMAVQGEDPTGLEDTAQFRRLKAEVFAGLGASAGGPKTMMQLLATPVVLPTFLPLILVVAVAWYAVLHRAAKLSIYGTVALFECGLLYGFILTQNWVMLVIMAAVAVGVAWRKQELDQGAKCLEAALTALSESPHSLLVISANACLQLLYTAMLVAFLVFCSQVFVVRKNAETEDCDLEPLAIQFSSVFTVLFLLTSNFFNMVGGFTVAYTIGCWYFHQSDPAAPPVPMVAGLKLALTSQNGTGVCTQAAVVMTLIDYMEQKMKKTKCPCMDPLWCFVTCMYTFFKQMLESLCTFALVAVALDGGPLVETSRKAVATLGEARTARFAVVDASLTWLLRVQAHALSTIVSLLAWAAIDATQDIGFFSSLIRDATDAERESAQSGQWMVVLVIFFFYSLSQRPLSAVAGVILYNIFIGDFFLSVMPANWVLCKLVSAVPAAILVGGIASIVFHMFAETAGMSLVSMLYCWSLEEATCGPQGLPNGRRCRRTVAALWEDSSAMLVASAPAPEAGVAPSAADAREVQMTPAAAGAV